MQKILAKQALKWMCAAIMYPVTRFLVIPALMGPMPQIPAESPIGNFAAIPPITEVTLSSSFSDHAKKQMQESGRRMSSHPVDNTVRLKNAVGTTATANKPASQPKSKTTPVNHQPRVTEVEGHKILINPAKTSASSVVIQPGSKGSSGKCRTGKT